MDNAPSSQPAPDPDRPDGTLRIRWPLDAAAEMDYCNQFAISKTGPEYLLQFGRLFLNLPSGWTLEEVVAEGPREVKVCARILLSHKGLIALQGVIEKGLKRMSQEEANEANLGD